MKTILFFLFSIFLFTSCISVKKFNERLEKPVSQEQLKEDVDFTYRKLRELHPELYWYISKPELDRAFSEVKTELNAPAKPWEFYEKLAPAISRVKQGHLMLLPPSRRYTRKEIRELRNQKGLFSRYDYLLNGNALYITKNRDSIQNMEVGSRILKINGEPVENLLSNYRRFITSDGYNETFQKYALAERWPVYFTIENGILDSVQVHTLFENQEKQFWLKREKLEAEEKSAEKKQTRTLKQQKTKDYDPAEKQFNRELKFIDKDSATALMTVRTFSGQFSNRFYRESYAALKKAGTENLILDVRNNPGGSVAEITTLYRYLGADRYPFIRDMEINSTKALFQADYYNSVPNVLKPAAFAVYPFYAAGLLLSTKKEGDHLLLRNNLFAGKKAKKNSFHGNLYLLVNGGSFSASSIIAAKLKADGRAQIVGEETGGANDGNIAGRYATVKLPNSKLKLPIGIMLIKPNIEFTHTMKGVIPHHEVIPELSDHFTGEDPELNFVLEKIKQTEKP